MSDYFQLKLSLPKSEFVEPAILDLWNCKIVTWHHSQIKSDKVKEHLIGRIVGVVTLVLAAVDILTGLGALSLKTIVYVSLKPFLHDKLPLSSKGLILTAWRVVIVAFACPVFAFAALLMPNWSANLYRALTLRENIHLQHPKPNDAIKVEQKKEGQNPHVEKTEILPKTSKPLLKPGDVQKSTSPEDLTKPHTNNQSQFNNQSELKIPSPLNTQLQTTPQQKLEVEINKEVLPILSNPTGLLTDPNIQPNENSSVSPNVNKDLISTNESETVLQPPTVLDTPSVSVQQASTSNEKVDSKETSDSTPLMLTTTTSNEPINQSRSNIKNEPKTTVDVKTVSKQVKKEYEKVPHIIKEFFDKEQSFRKTISKHLGLLKDQDFMSMFTVTEQKILRDLRQQYQILDSLSASLEDRLRFIREQSEKDVEKAVEALLDLLKESIVPGSAMSQNLTVLQEMSLVKEKYLTDFQKLEKSTDPVILEKFVKITRKFDPNGITFNSQLVFGELGLIAFQKFIGYKNIVDRIFVQELKGYGKDVIDNSIGWRLNVNNNIVKAKDLLEEIDFKTMESDLFIDKSAASKKNKKDGKKKRSLNCVVNTAELEKITKKIDVLSGNMNKINSDMRLYTELFSRIYLPSKDVKNVSQEILSKWIDSREKMRAMENNPLFQTKLADHTKEKWDRYSAELRFVGMHYQHFLK